MPRDWQRGDDEGSFDDRFKKEKKHKNDNYNRRQLGIGEIHGTQERQDMTREIQDPGKNQKLGSSSTSSTCCYVCVVRQGKLSPPSKPDKFAPFSGTSNDLRLQIKKPSTEAQF